MAGGSCDWESVCNHVEVHRYPTVNSTDTSDFELAVVEDGLG